MEHIRKEFTEFKRITVEVKKNAVEMARSSKAAGMNVKVVDDYH